MRQPKLPTICWQYPSPELTRYDTVCSLSDTTNTPSQTYSKSYFFPSIAQESTAKVVAIHIFLPSVSARFNFPSKYITLLPPMRQFSALCKATLVSLTFSDKKYGVRRTHWPRPLRKWPHMRSQTIHLPSGLPLRPIFTTPPNQYSPSMLHGDGSKSPYLQLPRHSAPPPQMSGRYWASHSPIYLIDPSKKEKGNIPNNNKISQ